MQYLKNKLEEDSSYVNDGKNSDKPIGGCYTEKIPTAKLCAKVLLKDLQQALDKFLE